MSVAAIITTHNRRDEVRATIRKLLESDPPPDEILICADGCTDGTAETLQREFPTCSVIENHDPRGSVYSRDRLLRLAKAQVVASFDDDSYPLDRNFFARLSVLFQEHDRAAVISFPELRTDGTFADLTKTPASPAHLISVYANCAAAMRRDIYLRSKGFPVFFEHMYEEPDYALQCYALRYNVWFDPTMTIYHAVSGKGRNIVGRHQLNARNELWSVLLRCPLPYLIPVGLFRIWRQFQYVCSQGIRWAIQEPVWWWSAIRGIPACLRHRSPIKWQIYYQWLKLERRSRQSLPPVVSPAKTIE